MGGLSYATGGGGAAEPGKGLDSGIARTNVKVEY